MNWILIVYIYAGMMARGDSVALTNVSGFQSQQECMQAGRVGESLVSGTSSKVYRFVCVKQGSEK